MGVENIASTGFDPLTVQLVATRIIIIIICNMPIFKFSKRYILRFCLQGCDFLELGPDVSKYRNVFIFKS